MFVSRIQQPGYPASTRDLCLQGTAWIYVFFKNEDSLSMLRGQNMRYSPTIGTKSYQDIVYLRSLFSVVHSASIGDLSILPLLTHFSLQAAIEQSFGSRLRVMIRNRRRRMADKLDFKENATKRRLLWVLNTTEQNQLWLHF